MQRIYFCLFSIYSTRKAGNNSRESLRENLWRQILEVRSLTDIRNNTAFSRTRERERESTFGRDTAASCRVMRSTRRVLRSTLVPSRHCSSPHTSSKPVSLIIGGPPRTSRCSLARHVPFSRRRDLRLTVAPSLSQSDEHRFPPRNAYYHR